MNPIKKGPFYRTETITSRDGAEFTSFAKTRKYERELYADLVVPFFGGGDFYAETWRHGPGNLPSNCSKSSKVFNVKSISISGKGIGFDTTKDHSKWLVGRDNDVICVGDINRQVSSSVNLVRHFIFTQLLLRNIKCLVEVVPCAQWEVEVDVVAVDQEETSLVSIVESLETLRVAQSIA